MLINQPAEKEHKLTEQDRIEGGKIRSDKKKLSAKIRELKKKSLTDETAKKTLELMMCPDVCDSMIVDLLLTFEKHASTGKDFTNLTKLIMEFRKIRHGTKEKGDNILNVNVHDYKFIIEDAEHVAVLIKEGEDRKLERIKEGE